MDLEEFDSVKRWRSRLKPESFRVALTVFRGWYDWIIRTKPKFEGFTPDDFVRYQQSADNGTRFDILDALQEYVSGRKGRASYKYRIMSGVRSFFLHNRAELPRDPSFIIRSDRPRVVGKLKVEDIRKIILSCNPLYQAVFTCMFQAGMGIAELEYWNLNGWPQLKEDLKRDPEAIRIDLPGRKRNRNMRPFFTFIGGDAIDRIRRYLPLRPRDAEVIFVNQLGEPVSRKAIQQYWIRHLRKLGYVPPVNHGVGKRGDTSRRYGLNVHELRDCFRSQWEKSPAKGSVAEFLMGHVVDPLEYNKAFRDEKWVRREYLKALPMLQILSSDRPYGKIDEEEVEALRRRLRELEEERGRRDEVQALLMREVAALKEQMRRLIERWEAAQVQISSLSDRPRGGSPTARR